MKGIQSLSSIARVAEIEVLRQQQLLEISQTIKKRVKKQEFEAFKPVDVSNVFAHSVSRIIQHNQNGTIQGIRLPGYQGLLRQKDTPLGKELALYAGASGIGGIIHSDEMPGYGFSEKEIADLKDLLHMSTSDAFVLALGKQEMVEVALHAVLHRVVMY